MMTPLETASRQGRNLALSVGVRVYLYADPVGKPVFHSIKEHPDKMKLGLALIETFEPPPASSPSVSPVGDLPRVDDGQAAVIY